MKNPHPAHTSKELLDELQKLVGEAESMVGDSLSEHSEEALSSLHERFATTQKRFIELYDGAKHKVIAGAKSTDHAVRQNPYQSVAIAAGVGLLAGLLLARQRR
jgi:ElaB/YqjD/DUF883 family membrane-anchored ribosome-binding protein